MNIHVRFVLLLLALTGCSSFITAPKPLSNEPLGGPCDADADCATGTCQAFQSAPDGKPWTGGKLCTVSCADGGACPSGTACIDTPQRSSILDLKSDTIPPTRLCIPTCESDADCQAGGREQTCVGLDGGGSICEELSCANPNADSACPAPNCVKPCAAGFNCVANEGAFPWCQKQ